MKKNDIDKIEDIAAKINDGELDINVTEQFDSQDANKIFAALKKIEKVSQIIRSRGESAAKTIKANSNWAHLKIKERIGQGGIGEVFRAFDPALNCDVAVKFLNSQSQLNISQEQFLQEARNMAKVRHPHVLAIHGASVDKGVAGYWSDYLDGQTLNDCINNQPHNWQQQLTYAKHLSQALLQIHKNNLVHGDIKPQNVMIQPHRGAILLDFGSSRKQQVKVQKQNQKLIQASPMSMAPEQFNGQLPNKASDVFSLGLLFWQLNTGKHPLTGKNLEEIQQQTNNLLSQKQLLQGAKQWQQLILSMVANKADDRPTIKQVNASLLAIEQRPMQRAKRFSYIALLTLAFGIAVISYYSNYKTKQANKETQAINTVLTDILMKSSPLDKGKDVLLIDVLQDALNALVENKGISDKQKIKSLLQLLHTYQAHSKLEITKNLATYLLDNYDLSDSEKMNALQQKAKALNLKRQFKESEPLFNQILSLTAVSTEDIDIHLLSLIGLMKNYTESFRFKKVLPLLSKAKKMWEISSKNLSNKGLLNQVEGVYLDRTKQYKQARVAYLKAIEIYSDYYGDKNLNTMTAKSSAATVLLFDKSTIVQGVEELEQVLEQMVEFLGHEHLSTLTARVNLASLLADLKQIDKAIDTIVPYMAYVYAKFGNESDKTLQFENIVAEIYRKAGKLEKADEIYLKIVTANTNRHSKESSITLRSRFMRVVFLQRTKQYQKAKTELADLFPQTLISLPENDHLLLDIQELNIYNQYKLGDASTLDKMYQLKQKVINVFGKKDPSVRRIDLRLGVMEKMINKKD